MRHPWRQETTPIGAEARSLVLVAKAHAIGGVDYASWSTLRYSKPEPWGHFLLHVSEFRWKHRDGPDYFADAPFSLYKVPYFARTGLGRLELPEGLSFSMVEAWRKEALLALNAPCPVSRWKARDYYISRASNHDNCTYIYATPAQRWALYGEYGLRGVSPLLDGYYRDWRRYERARLRAEHLALAVKEIR